MNTVRVWRREVSIAEPAAVLASFASAILIGLLAANEGLMALYAILGLVVGLVVLRWPFVGLLALVGSIAVENLFVFEGVRGATTGSRLFGMIVFGAWLLSKLLRRETVVPLLTCVLSVTAFLFFGFALASTLWARVPQAAISGAVQLAQFIALALITFDLARSWERVDMLVKALLIGATLAALLTVEQAVVGGARRAGGNIAGGINATAILLVTVLPFAFYLLRVHTHKAWTVLGITYIALAVTATIVTYSRMNLLVLPIILTVLIFHTMIGRRGRGLIIVTAAIAIGVASFAVPTDRLQTRLATIVPYLQDTIGADDSGIIEPSGRGYHMRLGLAIARDEPVIGAGFRNYGYVFRDEYQFIVPGAGRIYSSVRSPHSSHVGMLADLGGVGFVLWLALLLGAGFFPGVSAWRRTARDSSGAPHLVSQAIAYALGLQIFAYGWYSPIDSHKLLWILLGLAAASWALSGNVANPPRDSQVASRDTVPQFRGG